MYILRQYEHHRNICVDSFSRPLYEHFEFLDLSRVMIRGQLVISLLGNKDGRPGMRWRRRERCIVLLSMQGHFFEMPYRDGVFYSKLLDRFGELL